MLGSSWVLRGPIETTQETGLVAYSTDFSGN